MARSQSIFASRDFRLFYLGQAGSYVGDGLRTLAIPLLVYRLTGSALSLSITYALEFFPYSVFSVIGGSLADRLDRKRLMIACDAVRFAILAFFALAYWRGFLTLWMLYAGIVTISICGSVFLGSQASTIPYLLGKGRATRAVSSLLAAEQTANMVTPPIGGMLFAIVGPLPALMLNACTYLFSQAALGAVRSFGPDVPSGMPTLRDMWSDIAAGFRFLMNDGVMRVLSFTSLALNFVGSVGFTVLIPYMKRDFGASDATVGVALGFAAAGAVAGSLIAGRIRGAFGPLVICAYVLDGLSWVPVWLARDIIVLIGGLTISSALGAFTVAQVIGWRMRVIPAELVGRVFGAIRLVVIGGVLPGAIAGGAIADRYGARWAIGLSAALFLATACTLPASKALRAERR